MSRDAAPLLQEHCSYWRQHLVPWIQRSGLQRSPGTRSCRIWSFCRSAPEVCFESSERMIDINVFNNLDWIFVFCFQSYLLPMGGRKVIGGKPWLWRDGGHARGLWGKWTLCMRGEVWYLTCTWIVSHFVQKIWMLYVLYENYITLNITCQHTFWL